MSFKKKIMMVLGLGVVVIMMQMVFISVLSSQPPPSLPWVEEGRGGAHREGRGVTLQNSLQHVSSHFTLPLARDIASERGEKECKAKKFGDTLDSAKVVA